MRLLNKLTKQYNLGPWLGGVKDIVARTMFYIGILNFIQISATFYYITLRPNTAQYLPQINFGLYLGVLVLIILIIMCLEYKFIMPSSFTFQNRQEYKHQNLLREDLQSIKAALEAIKTAGEKEKENESRNNSSYKES